MDIMRVSSRRSSHHPMLAENEFPMIDNLPLHWELITRQDLDDYVQLRNSFYDEIRKSKKGERLDAFIRRLIKIKEFVERGDSDDWKRGLVCGIIFMKNSIAIHIQQFRLLLGKCKSSINGSLQQIGFVAHPQGGPIEEELFEKVPIFRKEHSEVKKWTVRDCTTKVNPLNTINKPTTSMPQPQINTLFSHDSGEEHNDNIETSNHILSPAIEPQPIRPIDSDIGSLLDRKVILQKLNPLYNVPIKFRAKYNEIMYLNIPRPTIA